MPCTLEPWEIEFEEKRRNKGKYGLDMTDERVTEYVACEVIRVLEAIGKHYSEIGDDFPLSPIAKRWWKEHKKRDRARKKK
jgi:hypothetical protein